MTIEEFWSLVEKTDGCWLWRGRTSHGYGQAYIKEETQSKGRIVQAHRFSYELLIGPIPAGLTIDHFIRNTAPEACALNCVRPDHLAPVTRRENTLRSYGYRRFKEYDRIQRERALSKISSNIEDNFSTQ